MKKIFCLLMALVVLISLAACGGLKSENKNNYNVAVETVETIDKYLDFEIDENELGARVERLNDRIEKNSDASTDMEILCSKIFCAEILSSDFVNDEKMLEVRNDIAESIGIKKR